jgi:YegS/Rv2252/BmrU family lipid kinase
MGCSNAICICILNDIGEIMKNIFIINPKAGKRSSVKKLTAKIEEYFKNSPEEYEIHITHSKGDGTALACSLAMTGEEMRIFACGGDGSNYDVLNGIAGYDNVVMGVIPCGTGNDFLKYFEGSEHFSVLEDQMAGDECRLDAIRAGDLYCLNQASMGLDAQVCAHKDKFSRLPMIGGQLAYILALFYCFFSAIQNRFTVKIDDHPAVEKDFLLAVAANGRFYGGGFQSAPYAQADDGLLECMTIDTVSRFRIISLLKKYTKGQHIGLPICTYRRGKSMTVQSDKEVFVNLDGEVYPAKEVTLEVVPNFVRFLVPKGAKSPAKEQEQEKEAVLA